MTERRPTEGHSDVVRRILRESCFYSILGITKSAGDAELKRAYKKVPSKLTQIVLEVHPDKNPDPRATEAFKKVSSGDNSSLQRTVRSQTLKRKDITTPPEVTRRICTVRTPSKV